MLKESIAQRYSEALFGLANEQGLAEHVARELDSFVTMLSSQSELLAFFDSPVVEREEKSRLLRAALEGRLHELTLNFIILLVRKRRENLIELVARQMHELLDKAAGREIASIETPRPLEQRQLDELASRLSSVYKSKIVPLPRVAPELLGGLVVQVGDRYVDASVAGKLEELRRHLLESADAWGTTSPNGKSKGS
jgi:F-type H+-transporting ATPase subunit delta